MKFDYISTDLEKLLDRSLKSLISSKDIYFLDNYKPKKTPWTVEKTFLELYKNSYALEYSKAVWDEVKKTVTFKEVDEFTISHHLLDPKPKPNAIFDPIKNQIVVRKGFNDLTIFIHEIGHALYHTYTKGSTSLFSNYFPNSKSIVNEYSAQLFEKLCSKRLDLNLYTYRHKFSLKKLEQLKEIDISTNLNLLEHDTIIGSSKDWAYQFACLMVEYTSVE